MRGQGGGLGNLGGLPDGYGRLGVASSYRTAALPFSPGMPPGGQRQRTWALGQLPFGTAVSYGAEPAAGSSEADMYAQVGTVAGAYAAQQETRTKLYKAMADLEALRKLKQKSPWMAPVLDWQISRKEAEIAALQERLAIQIEGEESTRTWRSLGQTGTAIGIVAGIGVVGLIGIALVRNYRKVKKNPRRRSR